MSNTIEKVMVENAKLFQEAQHQLNVMHALYDISVEISSSLDTPQTLTGIVRHAANLLNARGSTLAICEPNTNLARIIALYNVPLDYKELIMRPGASAASQVLVTGKPVIINDIQHWGTGKAVLNEEASTIQRSEPYNSILSVPLVWNGKVNGALTVMDCEERHPFNESDTQLLSLLANMASTALNNSNLYSQVLQLNQQLERKVEDRTRELNEAREELTKLHAATVYLQEEERARIARELHDGSNQLITGTLYEIQAALSGIKVGQVEGALERLETAKAVLRQIEAENRRIIAGLRPTILDTHGLIDALKKLANKYNNQNGVKCRIHISGQPVKLEPHIETSIYRIVQESLNNSAEHAEAVNVEIKLDFQPEYLQVAVIDDGAGFIINRVAAEDRMGLIGMRERAQIIGGNLELKSEPGRGTHVLLKLPLPSSSSQKESFINNHSVESERSNAIPIEKIRKEAYRSEDLKLISDVDEISTAIENLNEDRVYILVREAILNGISPLEILQKGIMGGLKAIGGNLESKLYSLGELLIGAKLAEDCIEILDPYLPKSTKYKRGVVVIGAVQGDIHSIGYGMVALLLELAGYEVHSLGVNIPSMTFVEKAIELNADIIGLSTFLVTTVPFCDEVINYMKSKGVRERFKVIIGGSETSQLLANLIGADGWSSDAFEAIRLCNRLLGLDVQQ